MVDVEKDFLGGTKIERKEFSKLTGDADRVMGHLGGDCDYVYYYKGICPITLMIREEDGGHTYVKPNPIKLNT